MQETRSALRTFVGLTVAGAIVVGVMWIAVLVTLQNILNAPQNLTALSSGQENVERPSDAVENRENLREDLTRSAGRVIFVIGGLATLGFAFYGARRVASEGRSVAQVQGVLGGLVRAEIDEAVAFGVSEDPATQRTLRLLEDLYEEYRRRHLKLEGERRLAFHVLGNMTEGVLAVSGDRRVLLLNSAARRLLGLAKNRPSGRQLTDLIRIPQVIDAVEGVLAGRGPQNAEIELEIDQERALQLVAIELPAENAVGALVTIRDETRARQLERMRREFIANVSHELKTPLAAVKGYTETLLLGAKEEPETCTHFLEQINFQGNRLERLINDMLQLARAQAGTMNLVLQRVPLVAVIHESISAYAPVAKAKSIELSSESLPTEASVIADREALQTIVNNLIGNAVRYTPEGGHITVNLFQQEKHWVFQVVDDGIGIPEEDQKRIFERFYRVEKARDSTRGGTGLGLAIVKNLVRAMGGEIRLKSQAGKGSTFEVSLPMAGG